MVKAVRYLVLLALATAVLGMHTTGAMGSRAIGIRPSGQLRIAEEAQFRPGNVGTATVICRVTLTMELGRRSQIEKAAGAEAGRMIDGRTTGCRSNLGAGNNSVTFLVNEREEAWPIVYSSFSGTLPSITGVQVRIREFSVLVRWDSLMEGTLGCLWEGTAEMLINVEAGSARRIRWIEAGSRLPLIEQLEATAMVSCAESVFLFGSMPLSPTQTMTLVR